MPLTNRRNRVIRVVVWTAICFVIGALIVAGLIAANWSNPNDPDVDEASRNVEIAIHIVFGAISVACLPVVLWLNGRTVPRSTLRPKVLAAEKLRDFLAASGRGGEKFLDRDGSVESLQRRTGGWIAVTLGLIGVAFGTIGVLGIASSGLLMITLCARRSWLLTISTLLVSIAALTSAYVITPVALGGFQLPVYLFNLSSLSIIVVIGVIRGAREQGFIDSAAQTLLRGQARQERAIAEVRRGIARDMHDSLSHHLSVIAMYAGALSVREDLDADSVRESARLIAGSARRSGVELREVLTMLRGDDQGTVVDPDLDRLVRTRADTVTLDYQPPLSAATLQDLGALERTTIYRFVQEAITNAVKHAPGERLRITVAADENPETLVLTASNPRRAAGAEAGAAKPSSLVTGSGLGLLGLRERMEAMGGTLTVSRGDDFVLRATLPATGLATPAEVEPSAQPAVGPSGTPTHTQTPEDAPTEPTGEERP
ncbi:MULTISPECIES: sensor histidine kinase [Brevibacterium]|uniref:histidine kinase n=1 Tax=Brevibacterium casei S18 TaxID=1229781 RepID=K9AYW4_9MICO|nr:histidine kinase [Brevibacterium casei]EKU46715.1 histidine kinase [Brevibacterium casei S18]NJE67871.1 two-component sensor histidine kinase [Brevibacterium sp. LS14]